MAVRWQVRILHSHPLSSCPRRKDADNRVSAPPPQAHGRPDGKWEGSGKSLLSLTSWQLIHYKHDFKVFFMACQWTHQDWRCCASPLAHAWFVRFHSNCRNYITFRGQVVACLVPKSTFMVILVESTSCNTTTLSCKQMVVTSWLFHITTPTTCQSFLLIPRGTCCIWVPTWIRY